MLKHYRNRILQGMAFAFGVIVVLIVLADGRELLRNLREFPLWLFIPLMLLKLVNWVFRYMEWHYLLGVVGVKTVYQGETSSAPSPDEPATIRLRDNIAIFLTGFPMAISPGKVAEVLKAAIVKNLTDVPITRTAPVVLTERIVDGLAVLIIIGVAGLLGGESVIKDVQNVDSGTIQAILLFTLIAMVIGIGVIQIQSLVQWLLNLLEKIPFINRLAPTVRDLYASTYEVLKLKRLMPTVSFGLVAYGTDCIALYMMLRGFGVEGGWTLLAQANFILGFAVIVAALSAMPGGAGARELSVGALLVGIVGASEGVAASATLMNSFFQVGLGVLVGVAVGFIFRKTLFNPRLEQTLTADAP